MSYLDNLSLRSKFLFPIGIYLVILAGVLLYSKYSLDNVALTFQEFIKYDITRINGLNELYSQGLQSEQATRNILININDNKAKKNYETSIKDFDKTIQTLDSIPTNNQEFIKTLELIKTQWKELDVHKRKVQNLAQTNGFQSGADYLIATETPKWREIKDNILKSLKKKKSEVASTESKMNEDVSDGIRNLIITGIIAVFVLLLLSLYLASRFIKPIKSLTSAALQIAKGNLKVEVDTTSNDETGILANAFNAIRNSIAMLSSNIIEVNNKIVKGNISIRIDDKSYEGEFKEIASGMNLALNSLIAPLNVTAEYVDRISKGDIPPKITDEYQGDFNEIKNNLNQCIDTLNSMNDMMQEAIHKQIDGDIDARCDASVLSGIYKGLITGVNEAMDAIHGSVAKSIIVMNKYADGDLTTEMEKLPGKQIVLTNALNNIRSNIQNLISDTDSLVDAAIKGRLDFRADASKHKGDYKRIIQGFNATLDAVIHPLNVAAEYIDRIAAGDIPRKIREEYQGDFNGIKNNLNKCIDALSTMVFTLSTTIGDQTAGVFSTKCETAGLNGVYQELMIGVNDALDALITPMTDTVNILNQFAVGDLSQEFRELPGEQINLTNSINNIRVNVLNLISDANMLAEAASAGRLNVRADISKHQGDYRRIIEGFNGTLDAVIAPLNISAEYLQRIAKGDFPPKITDNFQGDFEGIKNNLNQCIDAIALLVKDATLLSDAAILGDLSQRIDIDNHHGDYQKLVIEMNQLMNAIADPLNETSKVLIGMSLNDYDVVYQKQYNGVWQEMREAAELAQRRINNFSRIITNISNGDISDMDDVKQMGKRSENDRLVPATNKLMESIKGVIDTMITNSQLHKQGDIDAIADANKFSGEYAKLLNEYNAGIKIYTDNINNIVILLNQYADGNLQNEIQKLPGKQIHLSDSINHLRSNVLNLIKDTSILSNAAVEGKLEIRANAAQHKGDFRKIIEGINHTLDSIIHPMNVSAEYMNRIANGDIPPKIAELYRGDFNEIKNSLNKCIDSINLLITDTNHLSDAAILGNVHQRADETKHQGDYRKIIKGFNHTLDTIIAPINEAVSILELMANGDLSHLMEGEFQGDHAILKQALNGSLISINELLSQVSETVMQVLKKSSSVATASKSLSDGASEQAAAIEQMSASMLQIASQTKQNAENSADANKLADNSFQSSERGFQEMQQLQFAMNDINESSKNIAKIIKVIDEIAFQTNLLALNAAVEAARAGVHGQGFAVVAEEVRNLARRSADAAKETADLIEGSIRKVENGTELSAKTETVLKEIREQSEDVAGIIRQIAIASNEQATGINQIEIGFSQIDRITQGNTAGAEESASAAEELARQAKMLEEMLSSFELINSANFGATKSRRALNPINIL